MVIGTTLTVNPVTGLMDVVLDAVSVAADAAPQTGTGSPQNVVTSRKAGDEYVDTNTGIKYTNPTAGVTTGREIIQTAPAI